MPELPEVETTLRGIKPYIENQSIVKLVIRHYQLRWRIPSNLSTNLLGQKIKQVKRRGKYLLFEINTGFLIVHLEMSGSIRVLTKPNAPKKHDHVDIEFANKIILRFTDPRRFGAILWINSHYDQHPLLAKLGIEPLTPQLTGKYLWQRAKKRRIPIKSFIMDNKIVVGIGNIYATEALFSAGIHPLQPANEVSQEKCFRLAKAIKSILRAAIKAGGTTLRNFVDSKGKPGYFIQELQVYGRKGLPCFKCNQPILAIRIAARNTFYCQYCQSKTL